MAGGSIPGPMTELGDPAVIDEGTLPRIGIPLPGPIGLQAKKPGGSAKIVSGEQIAGLARQKLGSRVPPRGECFDLADWALRTAGAKSAADYGSVEREADYVWGSQVSLAEVRIGDIIQFRDYRCDRSIDSETGTDTDFQERPHHTAIVEKVEGQGVITVLEQNAPEGSPVRRSLLFFADSTTKSGGRTTTIKVQGQFWFYRPQPR
jgi:CHAP domain-containing protein